MPDLWFYGKVAELVYAGIMKVSNGRKPGDVRSCNLIGGESFKVQLKSHEGSSPSLAISAKRVTTIYRGSRKARLVAIFLFMGELCH